MRRVAAKGESERRETVETNRKGTRGMHEKGQEPSTDTPTTTACAASYRNRHFRFAQILSFANKLLGWPLVGPERNDAEAKQGKARRDETRRAARVETRRKQVLPRRCYAAHRPPRARYHGNNIERCCLRRRRLLVAAATTGTPPAR